MPVASIQRLLVERTWGKDMTDNTRNTKKHCWGRISQGVGSQYMAEAYVGLIFDEKLAKMCPLLEQMHGNYGE